MKSKSKTVFLLLMLSWMATQASAASEKEYYFLGYHLPAPPAEGTDAYFNDFIKLHEYQDHRTSEQCASAEAQSNLTLEDGFGPQTGVLTSDEVSEAKILSIRVLIKTGIAVYYFKEKFNRPRPFNKDSSLLPCIHKPKDLSYPSGHATAGYALALVLAKKFPAKRDLILKQGLQIGENRLIGGVHHPSDVEAGRKLAVQLAKHMLVF